MRGAGHSLLQDTGISVLGLLHEAGFYQTTRAFTSPMPNDGGAALGPAGPVELPTEQVGGSRG